MSRKWLIACAVCAVVLLSAAVAFAVITSYGPVRVAAAESFTSTGDEISGWWWLRDSMLDDTARWEFEGLPTAAGVAKYNRVYLRFDPLVTNRAGGGAGYDASVHIIYRGRNGAIYRHTVKMRNLHPEMKDVRDSGGWGYSAMGSFSIPVSRIPADGKLSVIMRRSSATRYHVAANAGACTVEYLVP